MDNGDEVLVHITAPTTRQSDELYRSMADAYRHFKPFAGENPGGFASARRLRPTPDGNPLNALPSQGQASADHLLLSKDSFGSFPSNVSSGVFGNAPPPYLSRTSTDSTDDSVVGSSRLAQLERIQKVWKKQNDARSSRSEAFGSSGRAGAASMDHDAYLEDTQLAAQALQSQLSDGYSTTSEDTSDEGFSSSYHGTADPTGPPDEDSSLNADDDNGANLPEPASWKSEDPVPPEQDFRDMLEELGGINDGVQAGPLDLSKLPVYILAPGPAVSVDRPGRLPSQMTEFLHTVRSRGLGRFLPVHRSRALDADERGYWLVDTAGWPRTTQQKFWNSLSHRVSSGDLGWGVLLYREPTETEQGLGTVRMYCWGEVAEEIWLVLWICSHRALSGSSSKWLDAGDMVVIEMD